MNSNADGAYNTTYHNDKYYCNSYKCYDCISSNYRNYNSNHNSCDEYHDRYQLELK